MAQGPEIEVLGKVDMKICKMSGIGKKSGEPYVMLIFKYFDPYLNREVSLQPSMESDKASLKLIYINGWMPPST